MRAEYSLTGMNYSIIRAQKMSGVRNGSYPNRFASGNSGTASCSSVMEPLVSHRGVQRPRARRGIHHALDANSDRSCRFARDCRPNREPHSCRRHLIAPNRPQSVADFPCGAPSVWPLVGRVQRAAHCVSLQPLFR